MQTQLFLYQIKSDKRQKHLSCLVVITITQEDRDDDSENNEDEEDDDENYDDNGDVDDDDDDDEGSKVSDLPCMTSHMNGKVTLWV